MLKANPLTSLAGTLFPRCDIKVGDVAKAANSHKTFLTIKDIERAIEDNQPLNSKYLNIKPSELGPKIKLKGKTEDDIITASRALTKVLKQNPKLESEIYFGLDLEKEKDTDGLTSAYLASEAKLPTPETRDGERSFGYNPISDKLYFRLREIDREKFPKITIELNKKEKETKTERPNFVQRHKKALAGVTAALALGSTVVYPSLAKGKLTFDPQLAVNHFLYAARTIHPILSSNLSYMPYIIPVFKAEETQQKSSRRRKVLKYAIPIALAGCWLSLDLLNKDVTIPYLNIKFSGPINCYKAGIYSASTGLDWNRSVDLALSTDTLNNLTQFLSGKETDISKVVNIYQQLNGKNDGNVYNLLRFFLEDGRILPVEITTVPIYSTLRDEVVPKDLLPYWPIEERSAISFNAVRDILKLNNKTIDPDVNSMLNYIPQSKRPMTLWNAIRSGVFKNLHADNDKDTFDAMTEFLHDRSDHNPLETPLTNPSEVYAVFVAGGEGYGQEIPFIFDHLAIKYGIPKDHVKILLGGGIYQYTGTDPTTGQPYVSQKRLQYFPELKGNLVKDYPPLDNVKRGVTAADVKDEIKKALQLSDNNDVVYIQSSSDMPGFKIVVQPSFDPKKIICEILYPPQLNEILATPNQGKVIVVNDACEAEYYIEGLLRPTYGSVKPLKDCVGIGAVRKGELSSGEFEFAFISRLRDGYSIKDAVPLQTGDGHPVIYTGEGDYSWIDAYNLFG